MVACNKFKDFMKAIYFAYKRIIQELTSMEFPNITENEHRILYRGEK